MGKAQLLGLSQTNHVCVCVCMDDDPWQQTNEKFVCEKKKNNEKWGHCNVLVWNARRPLITTFTSIFETCFKKKQQKKKQNRKNHRDKYNPDSSGKLKDISIPNIHHPSTHTHTVGIEQFFVVLFWIDKKKKTPHTQKEKYNKRIFPIRVPPLPLKHKRKMKIKIYIIYVFVCLCIFYTVYILFHFFPMKYRKGMRVFGRSSITRDFSSMAGPWQAPYTIMRAE